MHCAVYRLLSARRTYAYVGMLPPATLVFRGVFIKELAKMTGMSFIYTSHSVLYLVSDIVSV